MKRIIIVFLFLFYWGNSQAQNRLKFIEEYIDFKLNTSYFSINGVYLFYNNSDKQINTVIQFPFASAADSVEVLRVYDINNNTNIEYSKRGNSIFFRVSIIPNDTSHINISYRQATQKENTYILKSTQAWGTPLRKVKYSFLLQDDISVEQFSYPPDSILPDRGICLWERYNFMPEENFVVNIK